MTDTSTRLALLKEKLNKDGSAWLAPLLASDQDEAVQPTASYAVFVRHPPTRIPIPPTLPLLNALGGAEDSSGKKFFKKEVIPDI